MVWSAALGGRLNRLWLACLVCGLSLALASCETQPAEQPALPETTQAAPVQSDASGLVGLPRADLTAAELQAFEAGRQLFSQKLPKLGPLFNAESCSECHAIPALGGSGPLERAVFVAPAANGDVEFYRKQALPGFTVPEHPRNVSRLMPPPLFGLGLVEKIPDATIRAACGKGHPDPAKQLGSTPKNLVARFGIKPFVGTVPDFVDGALLSESSVTTPIDKSKDEDSYPDPEVDLVFVETLAAFVRGLQPPPRGGNDAAGEAVFRSLGCAGCHVPDMPPAMGVFSDFCVHSMGPALANGIIDHEAQADEFRTTPLWGLRFKQVYLHDGRAKSLHAAIVGHAGEAQPVATAYQKASEEQRAALLRFLATL